MAKTRGYRRRGDDTRGLGMPRKWVSAVFVAGFAAALGFAAPAEAGPTVEKIKQAFMTAETFQDVSISDTRVGAVPNQVVFRLTYTVQQP